LPFLKALKQNRKYNLINPRNNKVVKEIPAANIFNTIVSTAWKTGDPGLIFIDEINRNNPTPALGIIESTNPCGEQPLLPYESCILGSINLSKMINRNKIDYKKIASVVRDSVRFLDNVIEINNYPLKEIKEITFKNRKIGLGVMGFAEMLYKLEIPYNDERALTIASEIMRYIRKNAVEASIKLAKERGSFPEIENSMWRQAGIREIRNATLTTIAPTGTISILAGTSSGIEPVFALSFIRSVLEETKMLEVNQIFEQAAIKEKCYSRELAFQVAENGSVQRLKYLPEKIRKVFVTSHDISPTWHVRMQAAFQKYTDNAVSKTVNLPSEATIEDVKNIFLLAHKLRCKGITVYRDGSKKTQVLYKGSGEMKKDHITFGSEYAGECSGDKCSF